MDTGSRIITAGGRRVAIGSHAGKTVYLAADHRGFALKQWLRGRLRRLGWKVVDTGAHSPARTDYPLVTLRAARRVGPGEGRRAVAIGLCGSGIGVCIVAAKVPGVHPTSPLSVAAARETRSHNNTNFLGLSADTLSRQKALAIALAWLREPFYGDPIRDAPYLRRFLQTARLDGPRK